MSEEVTKEEFDEEKLQGEVDSLKKSIDKEQQKSSVLDEIIEKSQRLVRAKELVKERALLAKENARIAKENQAKEKEVFKQNATDFYELIRGSMYVVRTERKNSSDAEFTLSDTCTMKPGELAVYWENERLILRPWNHQDYMLSMPAMYVVKKETELKMNRRGGHLKPASAMRVGRYGRNDDDVPGPQIIHTTNKGTLDKKPLYTLKKSQRKFPQMCNMKFTKAPDGKLKVSGASPDKITSKKMKFSGRDNTHQGRRKRAGAN